MPSRKTKGVPGKCSLPSDFFLKILFCGFWWEFGGSLEGIQREEPEKWEFCVFCGFGGSLVGKSPKSGNVVFFFVFFCGSLVGVCWEFSGNSVGRALKG